MSFTNGIDVGLVVLLQETLKQSHPEQFEEAIQFIRQMRVDYDKLEIKVNKYRHTFGLIRHGVDSMEGE